HLLLAAQGYQESRLDQNARSSAGAVGVMQIKPSTAKDPNVAVPDVHSVEPNIHAGTKYVSFLRERYFNDPGLDDLNSTLMSLAAYNVGPARMIKLRNQAEQLGYDPDVWFDNVEIAAARYVGKEPVTYVSNIYKYYIAYLLSEELVEARRAARERVGIE
ncbi:MAG: transglycosylase SLT domain-containing protein, partial [Halioglobus sp.]|nr:transglycosylase SLT domain-containing protein [Halioglobus sp.]